MDSTCDLNQDKENEAAQESFPFPNSFVFGTVWMYRVFHISTAILNIKVCRGTGLLQFKVMPHLLRNNSKIQQTTAEATEYTIKKPYESTRTNMVVVHHVGVSPNKNLCGSMWIYSTITVNVVLQRNIYLSSNSYIFGNFQWSNLRNKNFQPHCHVLKHTLWGFLPPLSNIMKKVNRDREREREKQQEEVRGSAYNRCVQSQVQVCVYMFFLPIWGPFLACICVCVRKK